MTKCGNKTFKSVTVCDKISAPVLNVTQVNPLNPLLPITVNGNVTFTGNVNLSAPITTSVISNPTSITLATPNVIITENISVCGGVLSTSNISPCVGDFSTTFSGGVVTPVLTSPSLTSNTTSLTITTNVIIEPSYTLEVNTISAVTGTLTPSSLAPLLITPTLSIVSPTVFTSTVNVCNDVFTTSTVTSCDGNGVTFTDGIITPNISGLNNSLTINGITTFNNSVVFNQPISVTQINPVNGTITLTGTIDACAANLQISEINQCGSNGVSINCGGVTSLSSIQSCDGSNINILTPVNVGENQIYVSFIDSLAQTGGPGGADAIAINAATTIISTDLQVCGGISYLSQITACNGGSVTFNSPVIFGNQIYAQYIDSLAQPGGPGGVDVIYVNAATTVISTDLQVCGGISYSSQLSGCNGGQISVLTPFNLNNNQIYVTNIDSQAQTGGTGSPDLININSASVVYSGDVTICSGTLTLANLAGCNGELNVTTPVNFGTNQIYVEFIDALSFGPGGSTDIAVNADNVIFSNIVQICNNQLQVVNIGGCGGANVTFDNAAVFSAGLYTSIINSPASIGGLDIINVNSGNTVFSGTVQICNLPLQVNSIQSCSTSPINITSDVSICSNTLSVLNLSGCSGNPININSQANFCSSPAYFTTIQGCNGGITVASALNMFSNPIYLNFIDSLAQPGGPGGGDVIYINSADTFVSGNLSVCNGTLSVLNLSGCSGNPINIISPVNFCTSPLTVNSIGACSGSINITSPTNFGGNQIYITNVDSLAQPSGPGGPDLINLNSANVVFSGSAQLCSGTLSVLNLSGCSSNDVNLLSPINMNSNQLYVTFIDSLAQPGGPGGVDVIDINSASTVFSGNVNVCNGTLSVLNLSGCSGNPINIVSPVSFCASPITVSSVGGCNGGNIMITSPVDYGNNQIYIGIIDSPFLSGGGGPNLININSADVVFDGNVQICSGVLTASQIVSCTGPLLINSTIDTVNANNYNLTNTSTGTGTSILGSLVGPGGNTRTFQSLGSADGSIAISTNGSTVNLSSTLTAANLGSGTGQVFATKTGNTLNLRSLLSLNPALTITQTANDIDFNYNVANIEGIFTYSTTATYPPLIWTNYSTPVQTNAVLGYSVSGDSVLGPYQESILALTTTIDLNSSAPTSFASIGATQVWIRYVNFGNIDAVRSFNVFVDPSGTFNTAATVPFQELFYNPGRVSYVSFQLWHNAPVTYTGPFSATLTVLPLAGDV